MKTQKLYHSHVKLHIRTNLFIQKCEEEAKKRWQIRGQPVVKGTWKST